jgi:ribosomal protein S18 acetylase RimI-like enzyme
LTATSSISQVGTDAPEAYGQIAALHMAGIKQGFLPSLGAPFLEELYKAMHADPNSAVFVARDQSGHVVGFVSGGLGMGSIYRQMFRRWPALLKALAPTMRSPWKIARVAEVLWFSSALKGKPESPKAELYSIVVAESARGTGVAKNLYAALITYFTDQGVEDFRIIVGDALGAAHNFYRKMGAVPVARVSVHRGSESIVYRHDISSSLS